MSRFYINLTSTHLAYAALLHHLPQGGTALGLLGNLVSPF